MNDSDIVVGIMASLERSGFSVGELMALTRPLGVTAVSLRTCLSRLKNKGVLSARLLGGKTTYFFSAQRAAVNANIAQSFNEPDWTGWDKSFWGIHLHFSSGDKNGRYRITKKLSLHRFAPLSPGFWIRPCLPREKPDRAPESLFPDNCCRIIRFHPVRPFSKAEAASLWDIAGAQRDMRAAVRQTVDAMNRDRGLTPVEAFIERLTTGERIVAALFRDPLLPREFLPADWPAPELRRLFAKFDSTMVSLSRPFWESILITERGQR
jgi:phenylacetic acid degradation operon negative regulatory protein